MKPFSQKPLGDFASSSFKTDLALLCFMALFAFALLPTSAHAQNYDTCIESGGPAYCVGPETGPFQYQVSDGNIAIGQGSSEASATAAYNQNFVTAFVPCNYNVVNNLPPQPPVPSPGNGGTQSGDYAQALYYGNGQYWDISWTLSAETLTTRVPIVYSGTHWPNNSCQTPFGPFGVYIQRVRTVTCPGEYVGPYRPNTSTPPTNAYCYRTAAVPDPPKNLGCPNCPSDGRMQSNPVNSATGNKFQAETDYVGSGPMPLKFIRYYNSGLWNQNYAPDTSASFWSALSTDWRSTYDRAVRYGASLIYPTAYVYRPDGRTLYFKLTNGTFAPDADIADHLTELTDQGGNLTGWQYTVAENDDVETYDANGKLTTITSRSGLKQVLAYNSNDQLASVTDDFGHTLTFAYDGNGHLQTMTDPASHVYTYAYNTSSYPYSTAGLLTSVTYPDNAVRTYVYNESANTSGMTFYYALTGIVDENNTRYATFQYDTSGRAITSQHAGGADNYNFNYGGTQTIVTDPLGTARTYTFSILIGVTRPTALNTPCLINCAGAAAAFTYDANSNIASRTDFNSNVTNYSYDLTRNLETSRTEAFGTSIARTITTQWSPTWREPSFITEPNRTTGSTFDATGNVLTRTVTDTTVTPNVPRTWTYTYDTYGRVLTAKGPRTDLNSTTTYAYYTCTTGYQCGQVQTVTDALSHITTYNTYDAHGRPLTTTDPNGVVTTLAYDTRERLTSRQVGSETTGFSYYPTGLLKKVTLPDNSTLQYTYDGAHRLTQITDGLSNNIVYTLDAAGNRTAENTYDPLSVLHRTHTRVMNALNEVYQEISAAGTAAVTTTFAYDNNGNQTSIQAPLARNTANNYDALNRLSQVTDPASGITKFTYDANDNLLSVQDPRTFTTSYTYNGFGDVKTQVSPDTATTTNTYDSGGNLATSTDARNAISTYGHDASNRVTSVAYKIGSTTDLTETYTYDTGTNGKGRLTGASDANHSMSWTYDDHGRVLSKGQTIGSVTKTVSYTFLNGDLASTSTPSGQVIGFGYNTNHQITSITVNGATLLSAATYEPLGPINGWTWGNGTTEVRAYNTDGSASQVNAIEGHTYGYDNALRITGITNTSNSSLTWTYGYDLLDRLNSATSSTTTRGWTFDANSNRLTQTGSVTGTYTISTTSNRLSSVSGSPSRSYTYDASGDTLTYTGVTFTYYNNGRMKTAKVGSSTTTYVYNALGQRVKKSGGSAGTVLMSYDEAGHIVGEYSSTGALVQETVWMGDIPVATIRPNGSSVTVYYVHADHLNAPRMVTRTPDNKIAWRWDTDPFGTIAPNQNPQSLGTFVYNLRYPGQYFDSETGIFQNYFRDFDPAVGRYVESDPIGLRGGANTYGYVSGNPISRVDPSGLVEWSGTAYTFSFVSGLGATITRYNLTSECKCGKQIEVGITAVGPSAGVGFKLTGTVAPFTISDPWPCPEIESLSGKYAVGAAGLTWGANPINSQFGNQYPGIGGSYGMTVMGDGIAIGGGLEFGRDKSITATVGSATVTSAKVKSCPCGK